MACLLFGAKPLSKPMLGYSQIDPLEQSSVKFWSKYKTFHSQKCVWKHRLRPPFCPGGDELMMIHEVVVCHRNIHSVFLSCHALRSSLFLFWKKNHEFWQQLFQTCMVELLDTKVVCSTFWGCLRLSIISASKFIDWMLLMNSRSIAYWYSLRRTNNCRIAWHNHLYQTGIFFNDSIRQYWLLEMLSRDIIRLRYPRSVYQSKHATDTDEVLRHSIYSVWAVLLPWLKHYLFQKRKFMLFR